jgi:YD repeat-containing protein
LTNRVDAKGVPTGYAYNNDGQLTNVNYATDTDVQYFLDTLGRATGRVDAAGTWAWSYDGESSRVLCVFRTKLTSHFGNNLPLVSE